MTNMIANRVYALRSHQEKCANLSSEDGYCSTICDLILQNVAFIQLG